MGGLALSLCAPAPLSLKWMPMLCCCARADEPASTMAIAAIPVRMDTIFVFIAFSSVQVPVMESQGTQSLGNSRNPAELPWSGQPAQAFRNIAARQDPGNPKRANVSGFGEVLLFQGYY